MTEKLTPPQPTGNSSLDRWLNLLWRKLTATGSILWSQVSKVGSNLTDIETRNHADLQNINTASYTHLTATQATDLTDGGETTLHTHAGIGGSAPSNVISTPTTVATDTSYVVVGYLTITSTFTVNGNVGII